MKTLLLIAGFATLGFLNPDPQSDEIDSTQDEIKVKEAVLAWADSVFFEREGEKFEHFKAFYTDEYFIQVMRSKMYKERVEDLERDKETGRYKKSEEEYKKEHEEMQKAYEDVQKSVDNFEQRVTHFQIHFWSNIMTTDGITVYYEHIIRLDNNYKVTEATINSAIGKKSDKTEILYKKDVKSDKRDKKKTSSDSK